MISSFPAVWVTDNNSLRPIAGADVRLARATTTQRARPRLQAWPSAIPGQLDQFVVVTGNWPDCEDWLPALSNAATV